MSDPLQRPAAHLAVNDVGMDDLAEVVDGDILNDFQRAGFRRDLNLADMRAGGIGEILRIMKRRCL